MPKSFDHQLAGGNATFLEVLNLGRALRTILFERQEKA